MKTKRVTRIGQVSLALALLTAVSAQADPITVTALSGPSAADAMVNSLLGPASNITVLPGATYTGSDSARGLFSGGTDFLPFANGGVVMSTGLAADMAAPPAPSAFGTDLGQPGDDRLSAIAGGQTHDAALLTFSFTPSGDAIQLQFVFGSNEYLGFVGGGFFNDVFAAFLDDGTTIKNIALVPPGTGGPMTIEQVNAGSNADYFSDNSNFDSTIGYGGLVGVNAGFPVFAEAAVVPGQTYTLTLGIADDGDGYEDSGVLLAAQSFISTGVPDGGGNNPPPVPEPATLLLVGTGFCALLRRRTVRVPKQTL
jgi:hypothetical protein